MNGTHYEIDGERFPRVTSILGIIRKIGLEQWRGKLGNAEANRVSKTATEWGTRVHAACELLNRGELLDCEPDIEPSVQAYAVWLSAHVRKVVDAERLVVSRQWRYAGTADLVAEMANGSLAVCDLKTSNSASCEYRLQLAAYQAALAEDGVACMRRLVIQLPSREPGALRVHEYGLSDRPADFAAFLDAQRLWIWHEAHKDDWKLAGVTP